MHARMLRHGCLASAATVLVKAPCISEGLYVSLLRRTEKYVCSKVQKAKAKAIRAVPPAIRAAPLNLGPIPAYANDG